MNARSSTRDMLPTFFAVSIVLLVCAVVAVISLLGRPSHGVKLPAGYHVVHVSEHEFTIKLSSTTLPAGNLLVIDTNTGTIPHEFVMFKLQHAGGPLPVRPDGSFDEDSDKVEDVMDSGSALAPHETRLLTADLDPGSYIVMCNLPGHYKSGMRKFITVK